MYKLIDIQPHETELIELLRTGQPFDTFEIAIAQDGKKWSVIHRKQEKRVILVYLQTDKEYVKIPLTK